MNSVDYYRDPALDGLFESQTSATRRTSRHTRQPSAAIQDSYFAQDLPPAPDAPSGAPTAYPGTDLSGREGVQRSFSQRARGRPFAEDAFADDYLGDTTLEQPAQNQRPMRQQSASEKDPAMQQNQDFANRRQQIIQDNIRAAAKNAYSSQESTKRNGNPIYEDVENTIGLARAPTMRDPASPTDQRDWAPDRSPLQKLEVTLNDISKEEKRARVQEAEMLHREKTRGKMSQERTSARGPATAEAHPTTIEDAGLVRNLSSTHKDRLQHSTVIESRKPDARRLSNDKPGFEYQSAALPSPTRSVTITRRGQANRQSNLNPQRAVSSSQAQPSAEPVSSVPQPRSISASQPTAQPLPTEAWPAPDNRRNRQRAPITTDRGLSAQERNASHRAALDQLTGNRAAAVPVGGNKNRKLHEAFDDRSQPQRLSSSTDRVAPQAERSGPAGARAATLDPQQPRTLTPQNQAIPTGLDLQNSPGLTSIDSPRLNETPMQKQKRQSNVSFKDPYDRRRPVDEWKAAETARLQAEDFLLEPQSDTTQNAAWWEQDAKTRRRSSRARAAGATQSAAIDDRSARFEPNLYIKCGPLLRYTGMKRTNGEGAKEYWRGTLMMVTSDSQSSYITPPTLRLYAQPKTLQSHPTSAEGDERLPQEYLDPLAGSIKMSRIGRALYVRPVHDLPDNRDLSRIETDDGLFESSPPMTNANGQTTSVVPVSTRLSESNGEKLGRFREIKGVRLYADPDRDVTFWLFKLEIQLGSEQQHIGYRINGGAASGFWVPAQGQAMNIMFHSCNGFSISVTPDDFSGPDPLWRDVLNVHQRRPFHVMIGGGDQIYNDKVMYKTQLFSEWAQNKIPHKKHNAPFTHEMREELESFYLDNYSTWFSQGLFAMAGAQIPMVNMWDDHDIIDGFGSYPHVFMMSPVFSGIGNIAWKYYMLFQQHSVEAMTQADEPSWVLGYKPGPYIKQLSRSIFVDLGRPIAFLALDCRTERTKNQVLSLDTTDIALERCRKEIIEGQTKHLVLLLGVPIAYPRMNWLENVLTSRAMDPIKALGRYGVVKGGFLNRFDGGVEVLDDLDDHWTAHSHKEERNEFLKELQDLAAERSVRITILSGDVHLGAIGQFYSNPKLKIPKDRDHRYMPNVISSAIVNTPPPEMLADVLNKRNKVHHLDGYTDESMIPMFTHDVNLKKRNNKHLLPRRNWCSISEYVPGRTPPSSRDTSPSRSDIDEPYEDDLRPQPKRRFSLSRDDINPRMLMRRISSRNAPPTAYREGGTTDLDDFQRPASFDETRNDRSKPRSWNERLGLGRRTASETRQPMYDEEVSHDNVNTRKPPPLRPGFHRRPTNHSEKAAKKGNVPAVDAEGNEFDVNDHVNLDGGLDIVLNCEVDRADPSGFTEPYRLLVPALWYDGSSDREKLDAAEGLQRKPTMMNRMGFGGRKGHKAAQNQGAGNWGQQMSETESCSGSDHEAGEQPKKKTGFFGSLNRKRGQQDLDDDIRRDDRPTTMTTQPFDPSKTQSATRGGAAFHEATTAPAASASADGPDDMSYQDHDKLQTMLATARSGPQATFNQPPEQQTRSIPSAPPKRSSSFKASNLLKKNSRKQQPQGDRGFDTTPQATSSYGPTADRDRAAGAMDMPRYLPEPQSQPQIQPYTEPMSPNTARRNSYTIVSHRQSSRKSGQPIDTDTAHTAKQPGNGVASSPAAAAAAGPPSSYTSGPFPSHKHEPQGSSARSSTTGPSFSRTDGPFNSHKHEPQGSSNPSTTGGPFSSSTNGPFPFHRGELQGSMTRNTGSEPRLSSTDGPFPSHKHEPRGMSTRSSSYRNPGLSKQEQVLGIGTDHDAFSGNPQQRSLRGTGILGKDATNTSASVDQFQLDKQVHEQGQDDFGAPQRTTSQGYTGIEAYREKPKRGMSLRDRARGFFDRVEGKNKRDNDDDDDDDGDDYSYHSSNEDYYSDDLGEEDREHDGRRQDDRDRIDRDRDYDGRESSLLERDNDGRPEPPKRSMSQKLKGMMRMGSSSRKTGGGEKEKDESYY